MKIDKMFNLLSPGCFYFPFLGCNELPYLHRKCSCAASCETMNSAACRSRLTRFITQRLAILIMQHVAANDIVKAVKPRRSNQSEAAVSSWTDCPIIAADVYLPTVQMLLSCKTGCCYAPPRHTRSWSFHLPDDL